MIRCCIALDTSTIWEKGQLSPKLHSMITKNVEFFIEQNVDGGNYLENA